MKRSKRMVSVVILGLLLFSIISVREPSESLGMARDESVNARVSRTNGDVGVTDVGDYFLYLPLVAKKFPPPPSVFGVQMNPVSQRGGLDKVAEAWTTWVGYVMIDWSAVEPTQGTRNWSASVEQQLINATENYLTPIVNVRLTPEWARKYRDYSCGPMARQYFDEFADFMFDAVARYSQPPYNVEYWEIWNEPDVDPAETPFKWIGCWGDKNDSYYGGGYYADMLKIVYPRIKQADPDAQVLVGGLLLDCDPNNPPPGKDCTSSKFLEGILVNGGGNYFDGVSFHAYEYYNGQLGTYSNPNWHSTWNTTGPVMTAKKSYLQSLLNKYKVPGKYLINTECALLGDGRAGDSDFEQTKAYYVAQSYATAIAGGLKGNLWYSVLGWRNSGLLDENLNPLPAYDAYKFGRQELGGAAFVGGVGAGDVSNPSGLKGYKFNTDEGVVWILWSRDGQNHTVTLTPGTPRAVYNTYGVSQAATNPIQVGLEPVYLEW